MFGLSNAESSIRMKHKTLLHAILTRLIKEFQKLDYLLSFTFVGSGRKLLNEGENNYVSREIHQYWKVLDLDFVIVVDRLNDQKIKKINSIFKKICQSINIPDIKIKYETRVGPIKLVTRKNLQIMFHRLLFDERLYKEYCKINRLTPFNWQLYTPILGQPLRKIFEIDNITPKDLLESRSGVNHYIKMLETHTINPKLLRKHGLQYNYTTTTLHLNEQCYIKLILDSVIKCAGNFVKLYKPIYIEDEYNISHIFYQMFDDFKFNKLPMIFVNYKNLINCIPCKPTPDFILGLKELSLVFLKEIRNYLKKEA